MYTNYPIFKKALELNAYIESIVMHFSKYHKYSMGDELRKKAREIIFMISKVYFSKEREKDLIVLRDKIEEMKIVVYLCKEIKAFRSFKQFEISSKFTHELGKQAQGWLGSLKKSFLNSSINSSKAWNVNFNNGNNSCSLEDALKYKEINASYYGHFKHANSYNLRKKLEMENWR